MKFMFDLQLFADESAPIESAPDGQAPESSTEPSFGEMSAQEQAKVLADRFINRQAQAPVEESKAEQPPVEPLAPTEEKPESDPVEPEEPKHRIKVNGEDVELPLSEILKRAEKATGADKKFEEAASIRKEFEALRQQVSMPQKPPTPVEQAEKDIEEFATRFREVNGVDYEFWNPAHNAIFQNYQISRQQQAAMQQQHQTVMANAMSWIEQHPQETKQIEDAIWESRDPALVNALSQLKSGKADMNQIQLVSQFGDKVLTTPKPSPVPKEISTPKDVPIPVEKPGAQPDSAKQERQIDWDRFKTDRNYQERVLALRIRKK